MLYNDLGGGGKETWKTSGKGSNFIRPRTMNSFNWTQALMSLAFLLTFVSVYVYMCFNNFNDIINVAFNLMMLENYVCV